MRFRIGFPIVAALVLALAFGAGCGDNDNGDNDNGGTNPTRTPARTSTPGGGATSTPAATATPGVTPATVNFSITATAELDGFQFTATYPTAKGSFAGAADAVTCSTTAGGILTKNDLDNGNLVLSIANTSGITFPVTITCTFDQVGSQTLAAGDLGITGKQASARGGGVGDPNSFTVTPAVS